MSLLGFIPDVLILTVTFIFFIIFREKISKIFTWMPFPVFLIYVISSLPFILIEENINCLPTGCTLIPWTVPMLLIFVAILGFFCRIFKAEAIIKPTIIFSIIGILFEFFLGVSSGDFFAYGIFFGIFMVLWVGLSYAYLVIVPLNILIKQKVVHTKK